MTTRAANSLRHFRDVVNAASQTTSTKRTALVGQRPGSRLALGGVSVDGKLTTKLLAATFVSRRYPDVAFH